MKTIERHACIKKTFLERDIGNTQDVREVTKDLSPWIQLMKREKQIRLFHFKHAFEAIEILNRRHDDFILDRERNGLQHRL